MNSFCQLEINSEECFLPSCFSPRTYDLDETSETAPYVDQENEDIMLNHLYDNLGSEQLETAAIVRGMESMRMVKPQEKIKADYFLVEQEIKSKEEDSMVEQEIKSNAEDSIATKENMVEQGAKSNAEDSMVEQEVEFKTKEIMVQQVVKNSFCGALPYLQLKIFSDRKKSTVPESVLIHKTLGGESKQRYNLQQAQVQQKILTRAEQAGRRLYRQAMERKQRHAERHERSKIEQKKLELVTKKSSSFSLRGKAPDASSFSTSSLSMSSSDSSSASSRSTRHMKACQRLYDLSKPKQMVGKQRRDEIMKAKERAKKNHQFPSSKISVEEAIHIYARGMKHLYALEEKRIASAAKREIAYQSYLIPTASTC